MTLPGVAVDQPAHSPPSDLAALFCSSFSCSTCHFEGLRPDNPLAQAPYLAAPYSLSTPGGIAALNAEVTRQAAMVAYIDNFRLMMLIALATLPVLLLRRARRPVTAAAED